MATEAMKDMTGMQQYPGFIQPFQESLQRSAEARGQVAGLERSMEADRSLAKQRGLTQAGEKFAADVAQAPQRKQLEQVSTQMAEPFIPTRDNAQTLGTIFALVNIAGFAMGAGGKRNAVNAMSAMNGMLEGYQQGRQDLYKREKDIFDTNLKQLKNRYDMLDRQLKDAIETYKTDKQAGIQKAELAYAEAGANFYKQYADKYGLAAAYEFHKQAYDNANKMWTEKNREEDRVERMNRQTRAEERRAETARQTLDLRNKELSLKQQALQARTIKAQESAANKNLKPPAKEIMARNDLRNSIIPKIEESLPVLDRLNKEGKWERMTSLLGVPRYGTNLAELEFADDKEALNLILTLAYFRSKEFETAGKALTAREDQILAPIYRSDFRSYPAMKNALEVALNTMKLERTSLERAYPYINETNRFMRGESEGTDAAATPSAPAAVAPSSKAMPTGDRLKAYADAHFGGDQAKAKSHLATQGYK